VMVPELRTPSAQAAEAAEAGPAGLIKIGSFVTEKLVNLADHSYSLEPNGNFTPDGKWIVFRANMRAPIQVYAVEVAKANSTASTP